MEARTILSRLLPFPNCFSGLNCIIGISILLLLAVYIAPLQAQRPDRRNNNRQTYRATSQNFVVTANDARLADKVASEAERFRKELAIQWIGKELADWNEKCPIEVEVGMHAGGETSFAFMMDETQRGVPTSWQMKIFGPPDRLLDAVLPHEVTHTIFATHFGRPLPRWADEGACTTVEHKSERDKNHRMLMDFLSAQPSRGIPFNRMFTMKNYPHDILPLYAQGYSLAKFLIMRKGKRYFLDYVEAGMTAESSSSPLRAWDQTTEDFYGFDDLSDLQISWLKWVKSGSVENPSRQIAGNSVKAPAPANRVMASLPKSESTRGQTFAVADPPAKLSSTNTSGSWYARQSRGAGSDGSERVAANRKSLPIPTESIRSNSLSPTPDYSRSDDGRLWGVDQPTTIWR